MTSSSRIVRRARPLLGTLVEIRLRDAQTGSPAFDRAFAAVERVHRCMSRQEAGSDVARINRAPAGASVQVDAWTRDVLQRAKELHAATDGLFDCAAALETEGSLEDIELGPDCGLRLRRPVTLTLDGIAKGYAVDRAVEALREAGVTSGSVNAGGDLRVFGSEAQPIHVRHPASPGSLIAIGAAAEAAVATSARYFSNSSLVDPRTRRAAITGWSATVIAADCTTADALTKPCLLERERANRLAAACGAQAILLSPEHPLQ